MILVGNVTRQVRTEHGSSRMPAGRRNSGVTAGPDEKWGAEHASEY